MERRRFLEGAVLAGLAGRGVAQGQASESPAASGIDQLPLTRSPGRQSGDMLYRSLGRTGVEVSAIGFGGSHFAKKALSGAQSIALVHAAIDRGITFMDNCWDYNDGQSEIRMGKALAQGGKRAKVFLETKIDGRTADAARKQIDESLRRLKTIRTASSPRVARRRRSRRRGRRGRFASSASPGTRTRAFICTCSTWRRSTGSGSTRC